MPMTFEEKMERARNSGHKHWEPGSKAATRMEVDELKEQILLMMDEMKEMKKELEAAKKKGCGGNCKCKKDIMFGTGAEK